MCEFPGQGLNPVPQQWQCWILNLTGIHEDMSLIPGLAQWVKDLVLL